MTETGIEQDRARYQAAVRSYISRTRTGREQARGTLLQRFNLLAVDSQRKAIADLEWLLKESGHRIDAVVRLARVLIEQGLNDRYLERSTLRVVEEIARAGHGAKELARIEPVVQRMIRLCDAEPSGETAARDAVVALACAADERYRISFGTRWVADALEAYDRSDPRFIAAFEAASDNPFYFRELLGDGTVGSMTHELLVDSTPVNEATARVLVSACKIVGFEARNGYGAFGDADRSTTPLTVALTELLGDSSPRELRIAAIRSLTTILAYGTDELAVDPVNDIALQATDSEIRVASAARRALSEIAKSKGPYMFEAVARLEPLGVEVDSPDTDLEVAL